MEKWDASSEQDLLVAHGLLMRGLVDEPAGTVPGESVSSGANNFLKGPQKTRYPSKIGKIQTETFWRYWQYPGETVSH